MQMAPEHGYRPAFKLPNSSIWKQAFEWTRGGAHTKGYRLSLAGHFVEVLLMRPEDGDYFYAPAFRWSGGPAPGGYFGNFLAMQELMTEAIRTYNELLTNQVSPPIRLDKGP